MSSKPKLKALFICTANINRSKTAAELFQDRFITSSAGFYASSIGGPTSVQLTQEMLYWADVVFVFENDHVTWLRERFPTESVNIPVINLDIADEFRYFDSGLVKILHRKMKKVQKELEQDLLVDYSAFYERSY